MAGKEAPAGVPASTSEALGPPLWPYQTLAERPSEGDATHPFDPRHYLYERYAARGRHSAALRLFYALRPFVPRRLQLALRRDYARAQRRRPFPAWPIEPILVEGQYEQLRERIRRSGGDLPFVNFWPNGHRFAFVLTHDVESERGIEAIPEILELERRYGFVSSWNFCAEEYPIPDGLFDELRAGGCEVGLHGIRHDGKLFTSRAGFEASLPKIKAYMGAWHADGFRSPATHRNADWMPELRCLYDSSFPDTDPFEPMAGGCCSIFPFFLGGLVELPITLVQDHTLFSILGARSIASWAQKSEWIIHHHGLINLLVHPDYMRTPERLGHYERFLHFLKEQEGGWHALPAEVAGWWKTRSALDVACVAMRSGSPGAALLQPTLARARERDGEVVFALDAAPKRTARISPAVRPQQRGDEAPARGARGE